MSKPLRWFAITWLVVIGAFTVGALLNGFLWLTGLYDPVEHDGVPPESLPWLSARLIIMPLLFLATFRTAMKYANE